MFEYVYTAPQVIRPQRYAVISHHDDADSTEPFVVLEARDEAEALERAMRIASSIGVERDTSSYWQVVEDDGFAPAMCPRFADEYFAYLNSLRARRDGQLQ